MKERDPQLEIDAQAALLLLNGGLLELRGRKKEPKELPKETAVELALVVKRQPWLELVVQEDVEVIPSLASVHHFAVQAVVCELAKLRELPKVHEEAILGGLRDTASRHKSHRTVSRSSEERT